MAGSSAHKTEKANSKKLVAEIVSSIIYEAK